MWSSLHAKTPHLPHVALFAAALFLVKAVFLLSKSPEVLGMIPWIIDDSFIIMRIARNIALGHGFSYDGIHPTTGAPFLWTSLTSLLHLALDKDLAIRATFVLSSFFGALATVAIYALAYATTGRSVIAWVAFLLVSLSGNAFFQAMNGMDTALFTLLTILTIGAFLGVGRPKRSPPFLWGGIVGCLAGITTLVRADGIFILAAVALVQCADIIQAKARLERRSAWEQLIGIALIGGLFLVGLTIWQIQSTGSPFPANQVGRRELALSLHGFDFTKFSLTRYLRIVLWNTVQLEKLLQISIGSTILALFALLFVILQKQTLRLASITVLYVCLYFATLVLYQWYFPDFHGLRYVNPATHLLFIFIACLLFSLPLHRFRVITVGLLTLSIISLTWVSFRNLSYSMPWAKGMSFVGNPTEAELQDFWKVSRWIRANIPQGTVIGVRDHGRSAMFTDRPIQDLAGNIDPEVPLHLRKGTLKEYLRERNVRYLLIPDLSERRDRIYEYLHMELPLKLVEEAPPDRKAHLYKIAWEGS